MKKLSTIILLLTLFSCDQLKEEPKPDYSYILTGYFDDYDNGYEIETPLKIVQSPNGKGFDLAVYYDGVLAAVYKGGELFGITDSNKTYKRLQFSRGEERPYLLESIARFYQNDMHAFAKSFIDRDWRIRDFSDSAYKKMEKLHKKMYEDHPELRRTCHKDTLMTMPLDSFDLSKKHVQIELVKGNVCNQYSFELSTYFNDGFYYSPRRFFPDGSVFTYFDGPNRQKQSGLLKVFIRITQNDTTKIDTFNVDRGCVWLFQCRVEKSDTVDYVEIKLPKEYKECK